MNQKQLRMLADSLSVFVNLRASEPLSKVITVLDSYKQDAESFCKAYSALCDYIYRNGDIGRLLYQEIRYDENVLTQNASFGEVPDYILYASGHDLDVVNKMISLDGKAFLELACNTFPEESEFFATLPTFPAGTPLAISDGRKLMEIYRREGYGFFARGLAFTVKHGKPVLIEHPDPVKLSDLKGYDRQKQAIIGNTTALLSGKNANNILLYGDKGTGKSSTVKAVVNHFAEKGLKIIELPLSNIDAFPSICAAVEHSPYKFIVFLDDLSFNKEDDNFAALKAFIEGGITERPENLVIYATSNRRHLVRESFADRQGDDIHVRDSLETVTSLSDRFGLEITFSNPAKDEYLDIIDELAEEKQLFMPRDELHLLAERFAIRRNGRSPRTARQFIMQQCALQVEEK